MQGLTVLVFQQQEVPVMMMRRINTSTTNNNTSFESGGPLSSSPTRSTSPTLMAVRAAIDAENAAATPSSKQRGMHSSLCSLLVVS